MRCSLIFELVVLILYHKFTLHYIYCTAKMQNVRYHQGQNQQFVDRFVHVVSQTPCIHTYFLLVLCWDNPWKDVNFAFFVLAVQYIIWHLNISALQSLTSLNLEATGITEAGLTDYLQKSTQDLIHLNLNHTAITEKIIPFLKSKIIYICIHDFG